jgi:hypothetical protein
MLTDFGGLFSEIDIAVPVYETLQHAVYLNKAFLLSWRISIGRYEVYLW